MVALVVVAEHLGHLLVDDEEPNDVAQVEMELIDGCMSTIQGVEDLFSLATLKYQPLSLSLELVTEQLLLPHRFIDELRLLQ